MTDDRFEPPRPSALLGGAIRRARAGRYTLKDLARRSGTSSGLLSLIERGQGNPSYETLRRVAAALDLSLPDLLAAAEPSATPGSAHELVQTDRQVALREGVTSGGGLERDWTTSMVLNRGQEARIRVLDGSLELALRDQGGAGGASDGGRPLAVDLEVRSVAMPATVEIPPVTDPRWMEIVDGTTPFEPATLASRMLFTHVTRCVKADPSSRNVDRWISELRGYFVKYEAVSGPELARLFR